MHDEMFKQRPILRGFLCAIFLIHSLKDASDFINYQYTFISLFLREGGEQSNKK